MVFKVPYSKLSLTFTLGNSSQHDLQSDDKKTKHFSQTPLQRWG